jgi:hypothetical protein
VDNTLCGASAAQRIFARAALVRKPHTNALVALSHTFSCRRTFHVVLPAMVKLGLHKGMRQHGGVRNGI